MKKFNLMIIEYHHNLLKLFHFQIILQIHYSQYDLFDYWHNLVKTNLN